MDMDMNTNTNKNTNTNTANNDANANTGAAISEYKDVWVFAEQRGGVLMGVVEELMGEGKKLAHALGVRLCAVLLGDRVSDLANDLYELGADRVYIAESPLLRDYTTDAYSIVISAMIEEFRPEITLYGATHIGRDLGARIAARINTGLTADCTALEIDPETRLLLQTRPAFGGNLMATITCEKRRPQMATVRPGVMDKAQRIPGRRGELVTYLPTLVPEQVRTIIVEKVKSRNISAAIEDADIIVAGGRGLGNERGFELLQALADKLGGVVGASRAAVDSGWIDKSRQVGQTGKTVKPKLYIACGISGAVQHTVGMQDADVIIAINRDSTAPIFSVATYGIAGDLYDVIPALIKSLDSAGV